MIISDDTMPQDISERTKDILNRGVIPNMLLKNAGTINGFISEKKDYQFWLDRVCGKNE